MPVENFIFNVKLPMRAKYNYKSLDYFTQYRMPNVSVLCDQRNEAYF